jgi:succinoglycan biosynthesis transport protein ExoP
MYYDGDSSESPLQLPEQNSTPIPVNQSLPATGSGSAYGPAVAMNPLPPALAATPDMKSLLRALKRRWLLASSLGIVAAALTSAAVWAFMPKKWVAENLMTLNSTQLIKLGLEDNKESASPFKRETLLALARAHYVIRAVVAQPEVAKLPSIRAQFDPVSWLQSQVDVTVISPELIKLSMTGTDPRELEQLVDAVALVYETKLGEAEQAIRRTQIDKLDKMIDRLQGFVDRRKESYRALVKQIGAANPGQRILKGQYDQALATTILKLKVEEQIKLSRLQMALKQEKDRRGSPRVSALEIEKALKERPEMITLETRIETSQKELKGLEAVMTRRDNPRLVEIRRQIMNLLKERAETRKTLLPEVKQSLKEQKELIRDDAEDDTKDEIAVTQDFIKTLAVELDRLSELVKQQGTDALDLQQKLEEFETEKNVANELRSTKARLNALVQESTSTAQIKEKAHAYQRADVKKQILMCGGAGGGVLGLILLAFAYWEFRARRICNVEDVVYGLGWRLVGQLPALPERSRGGLLRRQADPRYWQSLMTESVDATRTMILHAARVEGICTVMVTSAVSGEGKTSLSCHLACSLARAGRKTLLLDCDLRNPAAHRLFELSGEPGLCEVLRGEAQLADVIRATPAANLWMIPAGQFDEQALQMLTLTKEGFPLLLDRLKTQFDFIVVDSSPVLPVVDSLVIGQNVDVVVFSLLRDVSRIPSVYAAYQRLATLDIRILGAVVNGVDAGSYGYTGTYAPYTGQTS